MSLRVLGGWLLSFPPAEWALHHLRELLIGALRQGPIPKHVAFVMDGNRRYARDHKIETVEGHHLGFEALARILEVCYKSGVKCVTVYAFSIENFKRSRFEVDALMNMAKVKLVQISQHGELLDRYGAKIQVLGDRSLLREDVLTEIERACDMTSHNTHAVLNICFPYTSRNEITHAVRETVRDYSKPLRPAMRRPFSETHIARNIRVRELSSVAEELSPSSAPSGDDKSNADDTESNFSGISTEDDMPVSSRTSASNSPALKASRSRRTYPDPEQITAETINSHMFTADNPPCDLLVRTSGVRRLSDFMLWQCHENTPVVFLDCLWPEFDLWQFLPVLVEWQWKQRKMTESGRATGGMLSAHKEQ